MIGSSTWITPLLLIPGVALLILSTAVRYNRLHDEVHEEHTDGEVFRFRGRLLRDALVGLYIAVSLLSIAALSGVAAVAGLDSGGLVAVAVSGLAVMMILFSSVQLIREARRSLQAIEAHLD